MEQQQQPSSALPRLSRLPAPRSTATALPRPASPAKAFEAPSALAKPSPSLASRSLAKRASVANPMSAYAPSSYKPPESAPGTGRATPTFGRRPLALARRPQSQILEPTIPRPQSKHSTSRNSSQEENEFYELASAPGSDASDVSPSASSSSGSMPALPGMRKSRPSLSDRTVNSLGSIPPSPATNRRNSNFFNPQSPMTYGPRPGSSARDLGVSKLSFGNAPPSSFVKPPSPVKSVSGIARRPSGSAQPGALPKPSPVKGSIATPARRASSVVPPRTNPPANGRVPANQLSGLARPSSSLASHHNRTMSAASSSSQAKALRKPTTLQDPIQFTKPKRPVSMMPAPSGMSQDGKIAKPRLLLKRPATSTKPAPSAGESPEQAEQAGSPMEDSPTSAKSSSALRDQIAKAKAAHLARALKQRSPSGDSGVPSSNSYEFEDNADPFGQHKPDGKESLRDRIDAARRNGKLSIAAMELKQIPQEVMQMYDASAMEWSSVMWAETVDLIKFNAADNEIEEIDDSVFPDLDKEVVANEVDSKGLQFAGLKGLDLHGNKLVKVPAGLKRLERLSSLDLSRNALDNSIFDIITKIPSLREVNLSHNKLSGELAPSVTALKQLEVLNVSGNKLTSLPSVLRELKSLRILNASNNRLLSIDMTTFSETSLLELYISNNALMGALFPSTITYLEKLQVLEVANNSLATLSFDPATKLLLPSLKRLNVSSNRLIMLPDMSTWQALITLLAEENELTQFPEGFINLRTNLKQVNLERNNIRRLDDGIAKMDVLETLSLNGNPIPQKKYLTMATEDIKRDLARRFEANGVAEAVAHQGLEDDETF